MPVIAYSLRNSIGEERFEKVRSNIEKMDWTLKELITADVEGITLISQNPGEVNKKIF
ncbi:MAG: hypothetical protein ACW960_07325 [Candidatus Thorarchaeota archaeon]